MSAGDNDPIDRPSLGQRMALGAAWVAGMSTATRFLGIISTAILARLLVPSDFGLVALATLIAASLERLSAFNFNVWLVRHPDPTRAHYDTVWTLSVLRGLLTGAALFLLAKPLAHFFDQADVALVLMALAFGQVIEGFQNVGIVDFQKHLKFHKEFQMLVTTRIGMFVVTVVGAIILRNYWALIAGIITGKLLNLVLSYALHEYRPRFSLARWRDVFEFSKWVLAGSLSGFAYGRMDAFFIGKMLTTDTLGLYAVAREIADLASSEIIAPIRRVMLPGYAKVNTDPARMQSGFVDGFALILLIGAPLAIGIGLVADPLVRILLGDKWLACIPLVQLLSAYALTAIAAANQGPMLLAMGQARTLAGLTAVGVVLLAPALTWGVIHHGVIGVAVAVSAINAVIVGIGVRIVLRELDMRWRVIAERIWPIILALVMMALAVRTVTLAMRELGAGAFVELVSGVGTGALVYCLVIVGLWYARGRPAGAERRILDEITDWRARKAARTS